MLFPVEIDPFAMSDGFCQWVVFAGVEKFVHDAPPLEEVKTFE